jgi:hypothetical protein
MIELTHPKLAPFVGQSGTCMACMAEGAEAFEDFGDVGGFGAGELFGEGFVGH